MEKIERARTILDQVLSIEPRFGRHGPPRASHTTIPTRLVSGDPRWEASISRGYAKDPSGGDSWDLFELRVYGQQRVTAVFRGQELELRQYLPGPWEPIFLIVAPGDTTPLLPGVMADR
jgi:hypothetical protein